MVKLTQTKGFLYGHYDSRGGTMFVIADNRDEADNAYAKQAGWGEVLEKEEWKPIVDEDFIGEVTLHHAKPIEHSTDLEGGENAAHEFGYVIVSGETTEWPPSTDDEDDGCNFFDGGKDNLEYVAPGDSPVFFADGYSHPRWDDDAFSFFVVDAKKQLEKATKE